MKKEDLQKLLTRWHDAADFVSDKTKVYFVGPNVVFVKHACDVDPATSRCSRVAELIMQKPTRHAARAAYCKKCDMLYIGEDDARTIQEKETR